MIIHRSENDPFRGYFHERLRRIVALFNEIAHENRPKWDVCNRLTYCRTASVS